MLSQFVPACIEFIIFNKLHNICIQHVHKELKEHVVRPEQYSLALKRMTSDPTRTWRSNMDYSHDTNLKDIWNWQRYMKKAIEKYSIKLLGYKHYALNKIGYNSYRYGIGIDIVDDLHDVIVSLDYYLEKSLYETSDSYNITHTYKITNQIRMVADLALAELAIC